MIGASFRTEGHIPTSVTSKWKWTIMKCYEGSETTATLCQAVNLGENLAKFYIVTKKIKVCVTA